jgi:hypothetical protein
VAQQFIWGNIVFGEDSTHQAGEGTRDHHPGFDFGGHGHGFSPVLNQLI